MNPNKPFNPTPEENKLAIDNIKADCEPNPFAIYHDARAGINFVRDGYGVLAYSKLTGDENLVATFWFYNEGDKQATRIMAESLARQINSQSVGK